jgi:uncharacterized membrane protein
MEAVPNKAMPVSNETGMIKGERAALGRWVKEHK